jgi:hypothetical protein
MTTRISKKRNYGICAYCGLDGADTRDHAPPKLFLKQPLPPDPRPLIVPAHGKCNQKYLISDNDLASFLFLHNELPKHAFPIRDHFLKHAKNKHQKGLIKEIMQNSTELSLLWPSGEPITKLHISASTMHESLVRITQAIHFKLFEKDKYLPSDRLISGVSDELLRYIGQLSDVQWLNLHPYQPYLSCHLINFDHETFKRIWILDFYETFSFHLSEQR